MIGSESFQEEIGGKVGRRLIGETRGRSRRVAHSKIVLAFYFFGALASRAI